MTFFIWRKEKKKKKKKRETDKQTDRQTKTGREQQDRDVTLFLRFSAPFNFRVEFLVKEISVQNDSWLPNSRNEAVRDQLDVFLPHVAVLGLAFLLISANAVGNHPQEEDDVEERNDSNRSTS